MSRWIRFLIAIGAGIGFGLLYGWLINPVDYVDTTPDTLRIDYKTDYVLMVAEAYHGDKDLDVALLRLASLGNAPPAEIVSQAIDFARKAGYLDNDRALMRALLDSMQTLRTAQDTPSP